MELEYLAIVNTIKKRESYNVIGDPEDPDLLGNGDPGNQSPISSSFGFRVTTPSR